MATTTTTKDEPTEPVLDASDPTATVGPVLAVGALVTDQYQRTGIVSSIDAEGTPSVSWLAEPVPCYVPVTPLA